MQIEWVENVRRNHAIEHATVTLLLERGAHAPMGGYSISLGFLIWSRASMDDVSAAARDALDLLKAGNSELAISPYCGTNIVSFALVGALAAWIFSGRGKTFGSAVRGSVAGIVAAALLGGPLGRALQRHFTTLPHVAGVELIEIRQILKRPVSVIWISTAMDAD